MSRSETFAKLGLGVPLVQPLLEAAYEIEEDQIWREDLQSSPHGQHWHLSFHASSFPGDDPKACGRKALYTMLNIPTQEPVNRLMRTTGEVGKAIETSFVERFYRAGILLSAPPDEPIQTGYTDSDYWLTGSADAIIYVPQIDRPHVVEIKAKDGEIIEEMQSGKRSFFPEHRRQVLTYIGLTNEISKEMWPQYDACTSGSILYASRDRPSETHEFKFGLNEEFMEKGRERLAEWKDAYLHELLPTRPKEWKWTEHPCKWCDHKRVCKADYKDKVVDLRDSNAIKFADETYGFDYSYQGTREAVLENWQGGEEDEV